MGVLSLVAPRVGALIGIYQECREALEGSLAAGVLPSLFALSLSVALAGSTLSFRGFLRICGAIGLHSLRSLRLCYSPPLCSLSLPGLQVEGNGAAHRFGREGGSEGREPAYGSQKTRKPTRLGVGLCSYESLRQAISSTRSVGRSVGRSQGAGYYSCAVAACATVLTWTSSNPPGTFLRAQPRHSLAPCGHPSGKQLLTVARVCVHHLTVSNGG